MSPKRRKEVFSQIFAIFAKLKKFPPKDSSVAGSLLHFLHKAAAKLPKEELSELLPEIMNVVAEFFKTIPEDIENSAKKLSKPETIPGRTWDKTVKIEKDSVKNGKKIQKRPKKKLHKGWQGDKKNDHRAGLKLLLEKLVKRYGGDVIKEFLPEDRKVIVRNIARKVGKNKVGKGTAKNLLTNIELETHKTDYKSEEKAKVGKLNLFSAEKYKIRTEKDKAVPVVEITTKIAEGVFEDRNGRLHVDLGQGDKKLGLKSRNEGAAQKKKGRQKNKKVDDKRKKWSKKSELMHETDREKIKVNFLTFSVNF